MCEEGNKPGTEVGYASSCVNCRGERGEEARELSVLQGNAAAGSGREQCRGKEGVETAFAADGETRKIQLTTHSEESSKGCDVFHKPLMLRLLSEVKF